MGRRVGRVAVVAVVALAAMMLAGCGGPRPEDPSQDYRGHLELAMDYLATLRDPEGRWPAGQVPYVIEAASVAGYDVHGWLQPIPVAEQAGWPPADASLLAALRPLHAMALAADGDAATLAQVRDRVLGHFRDGQFGEPALLNDDAFALTVLAAAGMDASGSPEVQAAVGHLIENASAGGGWPWGVGGEAETDMTGLVLRGIADVGELHRVDPVPVMGFLATAKADAGGYGLQAGDGPNCDSTVWGIRVLALFDTAPDAPTWTYLLGLQNMDWGFSYTEGGPSNALCTAEAATLLGLVVDHMVPLPTSGLDHPDDGS